VVTTVVIVYNTDIIVRICCNSQRDSLAGSFDPEITTTIGTVNNIIGNSDAMTY